MNTISLLAGLGVILLAIELLVVVVVVGAVIYFIRRGIMAGRRAAAPYVQRGTGYVYRTEALTKEYASLVVGPQVEAISTLRGVRQAIEALFRRD